MIRQRALAPGFSSLDGDADGRTEGDVLRIGGDLSPGWVTISKAGIPILWDKRKGYGYAGATLVYTGDDLAEFDAEFMIIRESQKQEWADFAKKYFTKAPAQPQQNGAFLPNLPKPKALGAYHPLLAELGITQIVPKNIGQWMPQTGAAFGKWKKVISFYQFRPPVPLIGRPNQAIPDTKKVEPTALDAQEIENQAKRKQVEALQAQLAGGAKQPKGNAP